MRGKSADESERPARVVRGAEKSNLDDSPSHSLNIKRVAITTVRLRNFFCDKDT